MATLFDPISIGGMELKNRIFMAPMTRGRSGDSGVPGDIVAEYYAQRAGAGLLITEATAINAMGDGWPGAPGIYRDDQQEGWRKVADAVHAREGRIFMQIWHMGRAVLPENLNGERPLAPSEVAASGEIPNRAGERVPFAVPRAMSEADIAATVEDFASAAQRAVAAGLDGVEIHAANNFLIDSFLRDGTNKRTDAYGGPAANRARFLIEVVEAIAGRIGAERIGVRLSPSNAFFGIADSDPHEAFTTAVRLLNAYGLGYLHVLEPKPDSGHPIATDLPALAPVLRETFNGPFVLNGGLDAAGGTAALQSGEADAVAVGVPFIANPDLVERYRDGLPLADPDQASFYTAGPEGYIDYPRHADAAA